MFNINVTLHLNKLKDLKKGDMESNSLDKKIDLENTEIIDVFIFST